MLDYIVRHMLDNRKLDPRLGRWAPTERLLPASFEPLDDDKAAAAWARIVPQATRSQWHCPNRGARCAS